jgi:Flp pilus assembly protein TadG
MFGQSDRRPAWTVIRRCAAARRSRGVVALEAAIVLPVFITIMVGVWEVGRLIQVSTVLNEAAREGARLAAGGASNTTAATVALVRQRVRDHLASAGFPDTAYNGATITVTNLSSNSWTDPCDAQPLDPFSVTVTLPSGDAFDSLKWALESITGVKTMSATATWYSANDSQVVVDATLPL